MFIQKYGTIEKLTQSMQHLRPLLNYALAVAVETNLVFVALSSIAVLNSAQIRAALSIAPQLGITLIKSLDSKCQVVKH